MPKIKIKEGKEYVLSNGHRAIVASIDYDGWEGVMQVSTTLFSGKVWTGHRWTVEGKSKLHSKYDITDSRISEFLITLCKALLWITGSMIFWMLFAHFIGI